MQPNTDPVYLASQGLSETFPERFMSKIDFVSSPFGCWVWTACLVQGYGSIGTGGHTGTIKANRASWILFKGPIPNGLCVCHNCPGGDNRACVHPDHLFLGTRIDNNKDARDKGTAVPPPILAGEQNALSKLTWDQVRRIRSMYIPRKFGSDRIAKMFGVDPSLVLLIVKRLIWKNDPHDCSGGIDLSKSSIIPPSPFSSSGP